MYKHISYELKFDTTNPTNYTCYTLTSPIDEIQLMQLQVSLNFNRQMYDYCIYSYILASYQCRITVSNQDVIKWRRLFQSFVLKASWFG